jgi:hypothetical protein
VQQEVLEPTEEFIQQKMLDPTEDAFKAVADPVEEAVQQYVLDPTEDVAKIILDPVEEVIQQAVLDPVEDIVKIPLKAIEKVIPEIDVNVEFKEPEPAVQIPTEDIENIVKNLAVEPIQNIVEQGVFDPIEDVIKIPAEIAQEQIISPIQDILPEVDINIEPIAAPIAEPIPEPIPEPVVAPEPEPIVEAVPQPEVTIPTEAIDKIISEAVIDPIKEITEPQLEAVKDFVVDPILESIPEIDIDVKGKTVSEIIDNLIIEEPKVVEEQVQKIAEEQVKELEDAGFIEFEDGKIDINITLPKVGEVPFIDTVEKVMESLPSDLPELVESYGDIENAIENPSGRNVDKAVQVINDIGFDAGATAPVVPPAVGEALSYAADIDAIINAFEDPDAESLTKAYVAADDLMATSGGLPAGEAIGEVATIFTGLEALDGGIESAAEAVNVVNAANAVAGMAGATTGVGTNATAGFLPAGLGTFFTAASLVKPITSALKGGAAGTYARIQGEFDLKDGKFSVGGGVRAADTYRGVGDKFAQETMNSGVSMANSLVDDYGFEIDEQALNAAPENIMRLQTSGYYNREGRAQYGSAVGSEDFVVKLLQNGVLKPTENTPPEILTSNEAFASFVTDHLDKGRDEYAAQMYDMTDGTGEEMIKMSGGGKNRKRTVTSKASFATQEAAQSWADDNFEETYGKKAVRFGRRYVDKPHRFTTSYSIVPVEAGEKTRYELKKTTSSERISDSEYAEATKPKPKPKPEPQLAYDPLEFLRGLDLSNLGSFRLTL